MPAFLLVMAGGHVCEIKSDKDLYSKHQDCRLWPVSLSRLASCYRRSKMEAIFQRSSDGNVKQLCEACQLERRTKPSEFVSCPDSSTKSLISGKPLVKFKTSRFRTRGAAVSLCFISHRIKASCAANRVVSIGRPNWQKLFTDACDQITIFQLRPHGLRLNAICLCVHGTLEPYIMSFSIVYEIRDCTM